MSGVGHPATFPPKILDLIRELLVEHRPSYLALEQGSAPLLDPFAGIGTIHELNGFDGWETFGIELELEWSNQHDRTMQGSALNLARFNDVWLSFDAIVTSPCYGNRMADQYDGRDGSRRSTYRLSLGRELTTGSAAAMQWGDRYREFHLRAWAESVRVLSPDGLFILNIKDHVRDRRRQYVTRWHLNALKSLGLRLIDRRRVLTPGMRHGQNGGSRIPYETVAVLKKVW